MTKVYITEFDFDRLQNLLAKRRPQDEYDRALSTELATAEIVEPKAVPDDVITMNSTVRFKDELGDELEYSLVFPEDADISNRKISVLSPIGSSLIGHRVGTTVTIPTPKGSKVLTVEEITYQPERSGDMDL